MDVITGSPASRQSLSAGPAGRKGSAGPSTAALLRFIVARADEDELVARTQEPVDEALLDFCEMARLVALRAEEVGALSEGMRRAVVRVAALHADHPDFRREWSRPSDWRDFV